MKKVTKSDKDALRVAIRSRRQALGPDWMRNMSETIDAAVLGLDAFEAARTVACYLAMPSEVQTVTILDVCWNRGKKVCVPAWCPETKLYALAWLDRTDPVGKGPHGIDQPLNPVFADLDQVDLVLVPGLAFDAAGNRLGHGGGYYDRILGYRKMQRALRVGLAFSFQLVDSVPVNKADERMNLVVTEDGVTVPKAKRAARGAGAVAGAAGAGRVKTMK